MPTNTHVPFLALTTVHFEGGTIMKGDVLAADDPRVRGRSSFFIRADATSDERRQAEAELMLDSASATYQHPPAPAPIRMRARKPFHAEMVTSTHRLVEKGEEFLSDDPLFMQYAPMFERADQPRRK